MATEAVRQQLLEAQRKIRIERIRIKQRQMWQLDPMLWLEERFGEDPKSFRWSDFPQYKNHVWDGSIDPLYSAWMDIANRQWVGVEAGTGTSKTFWLSRLVFWFLDVFPNSLVVTSAPKEAQLTLNLWSEIQLAFHKFKKIRPKSALYNLRLVVEEEEDKRIIDPNNPDFSKSWHAVGFVAGVGSEEQSATKAQGFHREHMLLIVEETPGMPSAIMTAFKNTCTDVNNVICAVGNPDSELDPLHEFCLNPNVNHYRVSAYDYPNVVIGSSVFPGAVTQASIDRRLIEYGEDNPMFQSRVRGMSPAQSADSLIKLEWLHQCREHDLAYDNSWHAVGVDVANSRDGDKAALAWGRGNQLDEVHDFYCKNATHLAYNLIMTDEELERLNYAVYNTRKLWDYDIQDGLIGVDPVGVGAATVNAFVDKGVTVQALSGRQWDEAIPFETLYDDRGQEIKKVMYRFNNLRSQMWFELREDLRKGNIKINISDEDVYRELCRELVTPKYKMKDNYIAVEGKDDIRKRLGNKSPNKGDAVAYWNWTRKGYRLYGGDMPLMGGG